MIMINNSRTPTKTSGDIRDGKSMSIFSTSSSSWVGTGSSLTLVAELVGSSVVLGVGRAVVVGYV